MMKKCLHLTAAVLGAVLSGCFFCSGESPVIYELVVPANFSPPPCDVKVATVRNLTPGLLNMLYVDGKGLLVSDGNQRWAQTPDLLLQRFLLRALLPAKPMAEDGGTVQLEVQIFDFHLDTATRQVVLGVRYTLIFPGRDARSFGRVYQSPVAELSPESFAVAMAECAGQLAADIAGEAKAGSQSK